MAAALVFTPASGLIANKKTAVRINVTGGTSNDITAFNPAVYPTSPSIRSYIKAVLAGQPTLKSHVFVTAAGGTAEWNNVIFPAAGTWTVTLNKNVDDTVLATSNVTVT